MMYLLLYYNNIYVYYLQHTKCQVFFYEWIQNFIKDKRSYIKTRVLRIILRIPLLKPNCFIRILQFLRYTLLGHHKHEFNFKLTVDIFFWKLQIHLKIPQSE